MASFLLLLPISAIAASPDIALESAVLPIGFTKEYGRFFYGEMVRVTHNYNVKEGNVFGWRAWGDATPASAPTHQYRFDNASFDFPNGTLRDGGFQAWVHWRAGTRSDEEKHDVLREIEKTGSVPRVGPEASLGQFTLNVSVVPIDENGEPFLIGNRTLILQYQHEASIQLKEASKNERTPFLGMLSTGSLLIVVFVMMDRVRRTG